MVKKKVKVLSGTVVKPGDNPEIDALKKQSQKDIQTLFNQGVPLDQARRQVGSGNSIEPALNRQAELNQQEALKNLQINQRQELTNLSNTLIPQSPEKILPSQPQQQTPGILEAAGQVGQQGTPLNLQTPLSRAVPGVLNLVPQKTAGIATLAITAVGAGVLASSFLGGSAAITAATTATPKAAAATSALGGLSKASKFILSAIGLGSISTLTSYLTSGRYNAINADMTALRTATRDIVTDVTKGADPQEAIEALTIIEEQENQLAASLKLANQYTLQGRLSGRTPDADIYRNLNAVIRRRQALERYAIDGDIDALARSVGTEET